MFGKLKGYERRNNKVIIEFEQRSGQVEIVTEGIFNIFAGLETREHLSYAIEGEKNVMTDYFVDFSDGVISIATGKLIARVYDNFKVDFYDHNRELICADYRGERVIPASNINSILSLEGHTELKAEQRKIQVIKTMEGDECFYGLGDKTGFLDKRGYEYEMWNSDLPQPQVDSFRTLYKSIPFFITLKHKYVFGIFFDNTYRTYFDMGKENDAYYYFASDEGNLDYYFILGENMPEVVKGYTYLTGTVPLPQLWTLGYHQSRYSYRTENEVYQLAEQFRSRDIPCDVIHLDIDYMEKYKVFTWNRESFPDMKKLAHNLSEDGFKLVTIVDPGIKLEQGYFMYDEGMEQDFFAKDSRGNAYENVVWPGAVVFPDFSDERERLWWGEKQKLLVDQGIRGIWNDMNEPASFNGELPGDVQFSDEGRRGNHRKLHNVYGHLMSKAAYDGLEKYDGRRPFVITRACFSGTQKYSSAWTGDNHSIWAHLQMAIPQLCNLGISGMMNVGTDIGGFGSDTTPELLSRWIQVGCFSPLFRNHNGSQRSQEPWVFNKETLDICRKYIKLRYRFLPYLYDLFWEHQKSGLPVIRPLVLHYEKDERVRQINDEFLFGANILVAPIVQQGQRARLVYLPEGTWVDYWTKERIEGGRYIPREAPLDTCPIYVKSGSILPNYPDQNYVGEKEINELILEVYEGMGEYRHYQDNGEDFEYRKGSYNEYLFRLDGNKLTINMLHNGYLKRYTSFKIICGGKERVC